MIVRRLLALHLPQAEVFAYGSRVNGTAHEGSDLDLFVRNPAGLDIPSLDLFVRNPAGLDIPSLDLAALRQAFAESNLPILVDVLDWARIPESFRLEISRKGSVVVQFGKGGEDVPT